MTKFENNLSPYLTIVETAEPSAPSAGQQRLYIDPTTHLLKATNSSGVDRTIEGSVPLEQHTASASATLDFTTFISATYDDYQIEIVNLAPANNGVDLYMRVGTGAGPTYQAGSDYYGTIWGVGSSTGTINYAFGGAAQAHLAKIVPNGAGYGNVSMTLHLRGPQDTASMKYVSGVGIEHNGTEVFPITAGFLWAGTTTLTAVRFLFSAGNIATGTIRIYGIAK